MCEKEGTWNEWKRECESYRALVISRKHCGDNIKCSSVGCVMMSSRPFVTSVCSHVTIQSIYRQSTENNPNFCLDSVKSAAVREDRSVVSLRAHTNMHLGLSKKFLICRVTITDVLKRWIFNIYRLEAPKGRHWIHETLRGLCVNVLNFVWGLYGSFHMFRKKHIVETNKEWSLWSW